MEEVFQDMLEARMVERELHHSGGGQNRWRHRFCMDFRELSNIFKPLAGTIPLIDRHTHSVGEGLILLHH